MCTIKYVIKFIKSFIFQFKIRKEALLGLAMLYKQHMSNPEIPESTKECISWIKNKVLHVYYQTALEDR